MFRSKYISSVIKIYSKSKSACTTHLLKLFFITSILSISLFSCATSPTNTVRLGDSPTYRDTDVAFRTIYYFRVFDYCESGKKGSQIKIPKSEALYRFTMTGKADTLFSTVKFESGTLSSNQIDPLGSQIIYDEELKRHRHISAEENKAEIEIAKTTKALKEFIKLKKENELLLSDSDKVSIQKNISNTINILSSKISLISNKGNNNTTQEATPPDTVTKINNLINPKNDKNLKQKIQEILTESQSINCPENAPMQRGFQILGPEGWRTFDQDQRLILAMSTSAKPLISTLKETSNNILKTRSIPELNLLPLVKAQLKISQVQQFLFNKQLEQNKTPIIPKLDENLYLDLSLETCQQLFGITSCEVRK